MLTDPFIVGFRRKDSLTNSYCSCFLGKESSTKEKRAAIAFITKADSLVTSTVSPIPATPQTYELLPRIVFSSFFPSIISIVVEICITNLVLNVLSLFLIGVFLFIFQLFFFLIKHELIRVFSNHLIFQLLLQLIQKSLTSFILFLLRRIIKNKF